MEDILRRLEGEADSYRALLADLEEAIKRLRRVVEARHHDGHELGANAVNKGGTQTPPPTLTAPQPSHAEVGLNGLPGDRLSPPASSGAVNLTGASIRSAAGHVLSLLGNAWTESEQIAQKAVALGYRSKKYGDNVADISYYFLDTMRRESETFERNGRSFRLRAGAVLAPVQPNKSDSKTLADYAEMVFQKKNVKAMRMSEIMEGIKQVGYGEPRNPKTYYNAVYSALERSPRFEKGPEAGTWELVRASVRQHTVSGEEPVRT
jgi:hypothetical protein